MLVAAYLIDLFDASLQNTGEYLIECASSTERALSKDNLKRLAEKFSVKLVCMDPAGQSSS